MIAAGTLLTMTAHPSIESTEGLGKQRIEALSDAIFAFAMTLLVLDVKIPKIAEALVTQEFLARTLLDLWPKFLSFVMSFVILSLFWIAHHGYRLGEARVEPHGQSL